MSARKFVPPPDPRYAETRYVVDASHDESHEIWHRWHCLYGLPMDQDCAGSHQVIGHVDGRPIALNVFWYTIRGARVAFIDACSMLVDWKMIEEWRHAVFPRHEHSNAANFHNIVGAIERAQGVRFALRNYREIERAISSVPLVQR